ncbi:YhcN/YlaJ family sporulation lipoprotein [Pontibacillus marinus]|uniref:YhcN/YlaJ family sporulation lipoprotein n=1 Tax=Pontibacillus marinus BH030004 = DSM 16465 TaxID=1385511 RepID=A0A0A5G437_9BACI|nr:YhcN/YlaJ family sporulation lipoprotein [Pontibacillus marinus]KGX85898.1 hypothetical protein N783_12975 [Pontibacillus marinus BH030004 = DSM 16465]
MKVKVLGMTLLSATVLFGCQAGDDQEARMGKKGNDYEDSAYNTQYSPNEDGFNNVDYDNGPFNGNRDGQDYDNMNNDNNNRYDVARKAAKNISSQVSEVDRSYVLTTENNAYVAVVKEGDNKREINDNLKSKIADIVKNTDPDIDNVYVSANPDFFKMTGDYVDDVRNGDPVRGFFQEFGQMTDRLFPEAE